jgi:UDP-N-acetyl-D-mannosaminuronic acid dehydrogenase
MVDINAIENFEDGHVCIIGLGYVGLTLAVTMASVGFRVMGIEIRNEVLDELAEGKAHFHEPGLEERLKRVIKTGHLKFEKRLPRKWDGKVYIITVGTPLDDNHKSRLDMVEGVGKEVSEKLKDNDLVIMRSTVKLGTTRKIMVPILNSSGKKFDLAFCPERTLEGNALAELRQLPQIIGGITNSATVRASHLFQFVTPTVVRVSDMETAEMIKLIDNAQRDVSFAYANEVARACDAIGVSASEVIQAGKLGYSRTNLPMPGPVGGPCLEKDSHILAEGLQELGINPEITIAARLINERQPSESVSFLKKMTEKLHNFPSNPVITLMGLAFKGRPETDDLRGTMAKPIFIQMQKAFPNAIFRGFDAVVSKSDIQSFGLEPVDSLEAALNEASLVLILNNHPVFSAMDIEQSSVKMERPGVIYDFWNCFNANDLHLSNEVNYIALGSHGKSILSSTN